MKVRNRRDYRDARRRNYDAQSDQIDAIMWGFEALIKGKPLPAETVQAVHRWRAVKERIPKPKG